MAYLCAFGKYLPERTVSNEELAPQIGTTPEWIESASGIRCRRFADANESVADLAACAADDCLRRAGLPGSKLGMIVMASGTPERQFPGPGMQLACRLGAPGIPVFDLPLPSTGALFGLALAQRFVQSCGYVLVVAAERMSTIVLREPLDRNTAILFGDGAGACLVGAGPGLAEIRDFLLCSDGTFRDDLKLEFNRPLEMNGKAVILQASRKLPRVIEDLLARNSLNPKDVDAFLLHQANKNLLDLVARALKVPEETIFTNIGRYGNTSSASMLIAASEWQEARGFHPGRPVVMAAFGAGFHWGAILAVGADSSALESDA
jgi:3-oxoacyl-[acyl-carrier-protein] synthase III